MDETHGHDRQDTEQQDTEQQVDEQRRALAEADEELDAHSDGEGLAAEAGRSEETGISQG